jgi:hypothetical protein
MRIALLSATLLVSSLSFSVAACASSDHVVIADGGAPSADTSQTLPATTDAASFCTAMCSRIQSCDKAIDSQTCENQCTNGNAAVFPRLRSDVVSLIVSCFDGKDCKTVLGGGFVGACTADAIASVAPSAAASKFCEALATAKKSCSGSTSMTKAACLDSAKLYGDTAIAQAQNCVKRGCSEIDTCVSAVFGSLGGAGSTTTTTDTSTSCSGSFTDLGSCASCAQTSCCAEATACYADSECHAIAQQCLQGGTTSGACSQVYSSSSTSAQQLASTLLSCSQSKCSSTSCRVGG